MLAGRGGAAFLVGAVAVAVVCAADPAGCGVTDDVSGVAVLGFSWRSVPCLLSTKSAISFDMELCASGFRAAGAGFLAGDGEPHIAAARSYAAIFSHPPTNRFFFSRPLPERSAVMQRTVVRVGGGVSFGCFVMSSVLTIIVPAPNQSKGN